MKLSTIIIRIAIIIAIAEALIMILLDSISYELSSLAETAIDSFLLVCLSTPFIYSWIVKPYQLQREQEQNYLFHKSRMAQMGGMMSAIVNQWGEPLTEVFVCAERAKRKIGPENLALNDPSKREAACREIAEDLEKIRAVADGLSLTINEFKDLYKPEEKALEGLLNEPIKKAINIVRDSFVSDGIEIIETYASETPLHINENEIVQVVLSLLINAQENFKKRKTSNPKILITTKNENDKTILKVCDNGGGIDSEVLPNIFDLYFSTKEGESGSGLGLYMSKLIVEVHHNGEISVENKEKGTCFIIKM